MVARWRAMARYLGPTTSRPLRRSLADGPRGVAGPPVDRTIAHPGRAAGGAGALAAPARRWPLAAGRGAATAGRRRTASGSPTGLRAAVDRRDPARPSRASTGVLAGRSCPPRAAGDGARHGPRPGRRRGLPPPDPPPHVAGPGRRRTLHRTGSTRSRGSTPSSRRWPAASLGTTGPGRGARGPARRPRRWASRPATRSSRAADRLARAAGGDPRLVRAPAAARRARWCAMGPHEEKHSTIAYYRQPGGGRLPARPVLHQHLRARRRGRATRRRRSPSTRRSRATTSRSPSRRSWTGCRSSGATSGRPRSSRAGACTPSASPTRWACTAATWTGSGCSRSTPGAPRRLVVDTGMHALGWSRGAAIDFMAAHTALATNNIANEVDRYIVLPGQALAYKIGQLEILRLRAAARDRLGAAFDIRGFHDAVPGRRARSRWRRCARDRGRPGWSGRVAASATSPRPGGSRPPRGGPAPGPYVAGDDPARPPRPEEPMAADHPLPYARPPTPASATATRSRTGPTAPRRARCSRPSASRTTTSPSRSSASRRRGSRRCPATSTSGGWRSSSRRASGRRAARRWSSTRSRSRDGVSMGTEGMKAVADQPRGDRRLDRAGRARPPVRRPRVPGRLRQDDPRRGDGARPPRHPGPRPLQRHDHAGHVQGQARGRGHGVRGDRRLPGRQDHARGAVRGRERRVPGRGRLRRPVHGQHDVDGAGVPGPLARRPQRHPRRGPRQG